MTNIFQKRRLLAGLTLALALSSLGAYAESRTSVNTSVNSSVYTRSNDDVVVNGTVYNNNDFATGDIDDEVEMGDNRVIVGNGAVDVGNGQVRVGNNVSVGSGPVDTRTYVKHKKKKRHYNNQMLTSENVGGGISTHTHMRGDCVVTHKQVGSITQETVDCP